MDHATAKAIINELEPNILIDEVTPGYPLMLVLRAKKDGPPFSITLPVARAEEYRDIPAKDAVPEQPAIPATEDHPGRPMIPAQPAVVARTAAGQMAEAEKKVLLAALDTAKGFL